jgi:hypothetical protein
VSDENTWASQYIIDIILYVKQTDYNCGFATDGDLGYDPLHETQNHWNAECFEKDPMEMPHKQHYHAISDILHILKRV